MNNVLKDFADTVNCLEVKYLNKLKSNLSNMLDNLEFKINNTDNTDNTDKNGNMLNSKKVMLTKIMLIDQKLLNLSKG